MLVPVVDQIDIFLKIASNGYCEVMFAGHQGASNNAGGVKGMIKCQPYDGFGQRLAKAFKIAGCNVFGSPRLIPYYDPADLKEGGLNACTIDPKKMGTKCGSPIFPDSKYSSWPLL